MATIEGSPTSTIVTPGLAMVAEAILSSWEKILVVEVVWTARMDTWVLL